MKRIAEIISVLFHPVFIPTLVFLLSIIFIPYCSIIYSSPELFLILILTFTTIIPLLVISIMLNLIVSSYFKKLLLKINKYLHSIYPKDFKMKNSYERVYVLAVVFISSTFGYFYLDDLGYFFGSSLIDLIYVSIMFQIIIALIISIKWKISLHMLGIGGLAGTMGALHMNFGGLFEVVSLSILASGILGMIRIYQGSHNYLQIYIGFCVGFIFQFGFIYGLSAN